MPYKRGNFGGYNPTPYDAQCLTGTLVLSADTYNEEQVLMPTMPEGVLPGFLSVEVQMDTAKPLDAAGDYISFHLSPKEQDAVLKCGDPDCICAKELYSKGIGLEVQDNTVTYTFPAPLKVSFKSIWVGAKAKLAQTIDYRIWWVPRASKVPQRDNLVSQTQF